MEATIFNQMKCYMIYIFEPLRYAVGTTKRWIVRVVHYWPGWLPWRQQYVTACHFIKISQVKKHDCHWFPGWLGMLRNEELLIRKNLVGPFWRNLTCSDFTMEQNSWKWGKMFSFLLFEGLWCNFINFCI